MEHSGNSSVFYHNKTAIVTLAALLCFYIIPGCTVAPTGYGPNPSQASMQKSNQHSTNQSDPVLLAAEQMYAQRINPKVENQPSKKAVEQVRWLDPAPSSATTEPDRTTYFEPATQNLATTTAQSSASETAVDVQPAVAQLAAALTQTQLLDKLAQQIRGSDKSSLNKALALAAINGDDQVDRCTEDDLAKLSASERKLIDGYRKALNALQENIDTDDSQMNINQLTDQLTDAFGRQTISIRKIELVRRIDGFGVYDPLDKKPSVEDKNKLVTTFLAGRAHKVGVYVEIDNYRSLQRPDGKWQVLLEHELELFTESDGLRVWRQPRMQIEDICQNKRRDFFYGQLITLPQFLNVGKYLLKVRVVDLNGQGIYEQILPIHYVADPSLTKNDSSQYLDQGLIYPDK